LIGRRHWAIAEGYIPSQSSFSDVPIVVQHTRLDSRRAEVSLLSTIAYAEA
jgi:hypothetical protein